MADQQEPLSLASTFPNPPPFWKDFTQENLSRIEDLRREYSSEHGGAKAPERVPGGVPEELTRLQPPAEPADRRWRVFGDHYTVCDKPFSIELEDKLPTLEDQGIHNLAPTHPSRANKDKDEAEEGDGTHYDAALELKRLAKSLLVNFLELTGTLATRPADSAAKVDDLRTLLINMHHTLNEYRPHQARESAAEMMQDHLDKVRSETVAVRSQVDKARRVLEGLGSLTVPSVPDDVFAGNEHNVKDKEPDWDTAQSNRDSELWITADGLLA
ncbi:hypothetical protein GMORB2_1807 [Geosmithia morbida]|uniref:Mediator of RNA polymerase II transcription subunit 7 n=1 Tax=Geosmithia morbida TaxID=1094350 RepID=A0A9P5D331_9HYPO|nr:uncharacterized protein GMORB2_1807 [Geosmithia morbida]KAF4121400.1 hypothetical protein GMORB2_1807 [Geosmithia morbida]